ncbi:hypothetical protein VTO42DRAFT_2353 [Malbranchea cinnamomea]
MAFILELFVLRVTVRYLCSRPAVGASVTSPRSPWWLAGPPDSVKQIKHSVVLCQVSTIASRWRGDDVFRDVSTHEKKSMNNQPWCPAADPQSLMI